MANADQWDNLILLADTAAKVWEYEKEARLIPIKKRKFQFPLITNRENPTKIHRIIFTVNNGRKKDDDLRRKKPTSVGKKIPISPFLKNQKKRTISFESNAKRKRRPRVPQQPFPVGDGERAMPIALRDMIVAKGGREIVRVLEKRLYPTDVNDNNNRLSMPVNKLQLDPKTFIRDQEWTMVSDKNIGLNVTVVDEEFRAFELVFKVWKMTTNVVYNLVTKWNSVVKENALSSGDPVQLWAFRDRDDRLCFALVKF